MVPRRRPVRARSLARRVGRCTSRELALSLSGDCRRGAGWLRDLTAEGVEANPGPCHGAATVSACQEECLEFDPSDADPHVCTCGHKKNRHVIAPATPTATTASRCLPGFCTPCVSIWSARGSPLNGTLVRHEGKFYVFSVAHGVATVDEKTKEVQPSRTLRLAMRDQVGETDATGKRQLVVKLTELPWVRCIHSAPEYYQASSDLGKVGHDCSVFVLGPLPSSVQSRAVVLFDWQGGVHHPSSSAFGVSLLVPPRAGPSPAPSSTIADADYRTIQARLEMWCRAYGFVLPEAISLGGQIGTGLTDKKRRLVSVISGNYWCYVYGREVAMATLVTRHLEMMEMPEADQTHFAPDQRMETETLPVGVTTSAAHTSHEGVKRNRLVGDSELEDAEEAPAKKPKES